MAQPDRIRYRLDQRDHHHRRGEDDVDVRGRCGWEGDDDQWGGADEAGGSGEDSGGAEWRPGTVFGVGLDFVGGFEDGWGGCVLLLFGEDRWERGGVGGRERCNLRVESRLMVDGNLE